eukprot:CAMPEP_0118908596 /NCGR_PEP_ID=MMETSP1166-20130328/11539_1 /TAXON_ID=1104430 /ORGANISM="Chrysoreinhardia sp, Strain CCMP3193" /LENGTH=526 /DNA_ID=CAMNT_0006847993 /DNA_START=1 /DNA_END=1581 /DNA_ORIENTATION=-
MMDLKSAMFVFFFFFGGSGGFAFQGFRPSRRRVRWEARLFSLAEKRVAEKRVVLDSPVYSLSTAKKQGQGDGSKTMGTMNIVTYASPVGIRPERLWAVSLSKATLSYEAFEKRGVLQLLTPKQASLARPLGGASGRDVDKRKICEAAGFPWTTWRGYEVLPGCAAYVELEEVSRVDAGDHEVKICRVLDAEQAIQGGGQQTLGTAALRRLGLIDDAGRVVVVRDAADLLRDDDDDDDALREDDDDVLLLQVLSEDPKVFVKKNLLTRRECDAIRTAAANQSDWRTSRAPAAQFDLSRLALAAPLVFAAPSSRFAFQLQAGADAATALREALNLGLFAVLLASALALALKAALQSVAGQKRTSSAVQLKDPTLKFDVADKVAAVLGADVDHLEAPVVSRYQKGDLFAVHNDASAQPERDWGHLGGQRLATCILYLNDVNDGGATTFDKLDVKVQPSQGDALFFYPADPLTLQPDDRTTHESTPAVDDKWIVQIWQRQRSVPPPLGLDERTRTNDDTRAPERERGKKR